MTSNNSASFSSEVFDLDKTKEKEERMSVEFQFLCLEFKHLTVTVLNEKLISRIFLTG